MRAPVVEGIDTTRRVFVQCDPPTEQQKLVEIDGRQTADASFVVGDDDDSFYDKEETEILAEARGVDISGLSVSGDEITEQTPFGPVVSKKAHRVRRPAGEQEQSEAVKPCPRVEPTQELKDDVALPEGLLQREMERCFGWCLPSVGSVSRSEKLDADSFKQPGMAEAAQCLGKIGDEIRSGYVHGNGKVDVKLAGRIIDFLNELRELDPKLVRSLFMFRPECNTAIAKHPTIQVCGNKHRWRVGLLGLLNGLCGVTVDGDGLIAVEFDEEDPSEILRFLFNTNVDPTKLGNAESPLGVSGQESHKEWSAKKVAKELDRRFDQSKLGSCRYSGSVQAIQDCHVGNELPTAPQVAPEAGFKWVRGPSGKTGDWVQQPVAAAPDVENQAYKVKWVKAQKHHIGLLARFCNLSEKSYTYGVLKDVRTGPVGRAFMCSTADCERWYDECEVQVFDITSMQTNPPDMKPRGVIGTEPMGTLFQYYHKAFRCKGETASDPKCMCWHDEGTGPWKDATYADREFNKLEWRLKPVEAGVPVSEDKPVRVIEKPEMLSWSMNGNGSIGVEFIDKTLRKVEPPKRHGSRIATVNDIGMLAEFFNVGDKQPCCGKLVGIEYPAEGKTVYLMDVKGKVYPWERYDFAYVTDSVVVPVPDCHAGKPVPEYSREPKSFRMLMGFPVVDQKFPSMVGNGDIVFASAKLKDDDSEAGKTIVPELTKESIQEAYDRLKDRPQPETMKVPQEFAELVDNLDSDDSGGMILPNELEAGMQDMLQRGYEEGKAIYVNMDAVLMCFDHKTGELTLVTDKGPKLIAKKTSWLVAKNIAKLAGAGIRDIGRPSDKTDES